MSDYRLNRRLISRSKLARRLVPIFVAAVAAPLIATVVVIGRVGQQQIFETAQTMQGISQSAVQDAGRKFQILGSSTVRQSSAQMAAISIRSNNLESRLWEKNQSESLATTSGEFSHVTQSSFDGAMDESLHTNKQILRDVSNRMGNLFASSARYTQGRVAGRVQTAILEQINTQMQERARQLTQVIESYIETNQNYLALTAQMLILYQSNPSGQTAVLDAVVRRMPMLTVVSVMDVTGQETAMSAADHIVTASDLTNCADTPYFKSAIAGQSYEAVEDFPSDGRAPTLRLAVPIDLYRGKTIGVLSARLSLSDLWDIIRNTKIGNSGFAYVTDPAAGHVAVPTRHPADLITQSASIDPLGWQLIVAQPRQEVMQPVESFDSDIAANTARSLDLMHSYIGESAQIAFTRLQVHDTALRVEMLKRVQTSTGAIFERLKNKTTTQTDENIAQMQNAIRSQALRAQNQQSQEMISAAASASGAVAKNLPSLTSDAQKVAKQRLSLFALVIIVMSCALSYIIATLMTSAIVRPIVQLAEGTKAVAHGELGRRVDERAPGEVGDLAVAFNTMAASLQKSRLDLTEAETQLVQSAKLASLGTLSAGVAHELNQPVAIVRGIAQQLRTDPQMPELAMEDLDLIEGQTSRMMKIIKHLRTFSRIGGQEMHPIDVNQVIQDCFILIGAQLRAHEVEVELDLCATAAAVLGDANELEQVFINLISNAQDAMEGRAGSKLTIHSRIAKNQFVIEFCDNGPGIPDGTVDHIFDPFFTTKEVGKGTGLGLSISHGIIEKHRGVIAARNDSGAVFAITLPLEREGATQVEQEARKAA